MSEWIRLTTKNDTNGNPRRVFVEIENGQVVQSVDEGYLGIQAAHEAGMPKEYFPISIPTTPTEYRTKVYFHKADR